MVNLPGIAVRGSALRVPCNCPRSKGGAHLILPGEGHGCTALPSMFAVESSRVQMRPRAALHRALRVVQMNLGARARF